MYPKSHARNINSVSPLNISGQIDVKRLMQLTTRDTAYTSPLPSFLPSPSIFAPSFFPSFFLTYRPLAFFFLTTYFISLSSLSNYISSLFLSLFPLPTNHPSYSSSFGALLLCDQHKQASPHLRHHVSFARSLHLTECLTYPMKTMDNSVSQNTIVLPYY